MKIYQCRKCGAMHEDIRHQGCDPVCCDTPMRIMVAGAADGAREKHVPAVTREGDVVTVRVGSVEHPMLEEHHIEWIAVETASATQRAYLKAGEAPEARFIVPADQKISVYEFCNLHGLWVAEA